MEQLGALENLTYIFHYPPFSVEGWEKKTHKGEKGYLIAMNGF